jgi:hypothetical protein
MKRIFKTTAKCLMGLTLIASCGDLFHDEFVRPERSFILLGIFGTGILIGGLIMPYAGGWLKAAVHDGLGLAREAKQVYTSKEESGNG